MNSEREQVFMNMRTVFTANPGLFGAWACQWWRSVMADWRCHWLQRNSEPLHPKRGLRNLLFQLRVSIVYAMFDNCWARFELFLRIEDPLDRKNIFWSVGRLSVEVTRAL